ncbi:MAG: hypothetical protein ACI92G_003246 [Candidatus Pelagisphaera sp.]|jgi:uncharacterized protein (TIGR01777 family)
MNPRKIAIMGASGFLGRVLIRHFRSAGCIPVPFSRNPKGEIEGFVPIKWNPGDPISLSQAFEDIDIVVNLCGKSVDCRYNRRNRELIRDSRTIPTQTIAQAIDACQKPPTTWINAASATIYEAAYDEPQNESKGTIGHGFSVDICQAWENAFFEDELPNTRRIGLRTALVLGHGINSVYPQLRTLARFGLGGSIGNGRQMVSWIHEMDFARAVDFLIENEDLDGVFNIASPAVVPNAAFMKAIREQTWMPIALPTPIWLLEIGTFLMRSEPELVLKSRFVAPERLMQHRFRFRFPFVDEAIADLDKRNSKTALKDSSNTKACTPTLF